MEAIREALAKVGSSWNQEVPQILIKAYEPVHAQQSNKYEGTVRAEKGIKYGPDARNRLDVYSPVSPGAHGLPVVVFFHGGGLVAGDNDVTPSFFSNIGKFFASNNCVAVLATYRLALQTGRHPSGAQDIASALKWVQANIRSHGGGDPSNVVALGHSAGGLHLFTALVLGYLDDDNDNDQSPPLVRGVALLSAPFTTVPGPDAVMTSWFGCADRPWEVRSRWSPAALFREKFFGTTAAEGKQALGVRLLLLVGEYELEEVWEGTCEFMADYRKRFGSLPVLEALRGQNHVSYVFGIGLDAPECAQAGTKLLRFVEEVVGGS